MNKITEDFLRESYLTRVMVFFENPEDYCGAASIKDEINILSEVGKSVGLDMWETAKRVVSEDVYSQFYDKALVALMKYSDERIVSDVAMLTRIGESLGKDFWFTAKNRVSEATYNSFLESLKNQVGGSERDGRINRETGCSRQSQ